MCHSTSLLITFYPLTLSPSHPPRKTTAFTVNNGKLIVSTTKCQTYIQLYFLISFPGRTHSLTRLCYKYIYYFARQYKVIFQKTWTCYSLTPKSTLTCTTQQDNIKIKGKCRLYKIPSDCF